MYQVERFPARVEIVRLHAARKHARTHVRTPAHAFSSLRDPADSAVQGHYTYPAQLRCYSFAARILNFTGRPGLGCTVSMCRRQCGGKKKGSRRRIRATPCPWRDVPTGEGQVAEHLALQLLPIALDLVEALQQPHDHVAGLCEGELLADT